MSKYELWLNSLEKEGVYPYLLENKNGAKLLQVKKQYEHNHNFSYITTYHVWNGDLWLMTENYHDAYEVYKQTAEESSKNTNRTKMVGCRGELIMQYSSGKTMIAR